MTYVYSTVPLPPVDTLNQHTGFVVLMIALIILFAIVSSWIVSNVIRLLVAITFCGIIGASAVYSWTTGDIRHYENRPVEATLVGFQAEGFNEERRSGKSYRRVDVHYTYVIYNVPGEGSVLLRAYPGQSYPDKAILYANKAAQQ